MSDTVSEALRRTIVYLRGCNQRLRTQVDDLERQLRDERTARAIAERELEETRDSYRPDGATLGAEFLDLREVG